MASSERIEEVLKICGFRPDDQLMKDLAQVRFNLLMMTPNLGQVPISLRDKLFGLLDELNRYLEVVHEKREKELNGK